VFANLAFKTITFFKIYIKIFDVKQIGMKMEKFWCEKSNNFGVKINWCKISEHGFQNSKEIK